MTTYEYEYEYRNGPKDGRLLYSYIPYPYQVLMIGIPGTCTYNHTIALYYLQQ